MFIDTNILISLFIGDRREDAVKEILAHVEGKPLFCSVLQLSEVADWCIKEKASISEAMSSIRKVAQVIDLNENICIEGANIKHARRKAGYKNFQLIDGLIAASAKSVGEELLTADKDLEGLDGVICIRRVWVRNATTYGSAQQMLNARHFFVCLFRNATVLFQASFVSFAA